MCEWGTTVPVLVVVPAELSRTGEARQDYKDIDSCLVPLITALNMGGLTTVACCCGHGHYPGRIDLADGRVLWVGDGSWDEKYFSYLPNIQGETKEQVAASHDF